MNKIHVSTIISSAFVAVWAMFVLYKRRRPKPTPKPDMQLYYYDNFRSKRCEWLLAELGTRSDVELIEMNPQDTNPVIRDMYREIHPHGTIPCLTVCEPGDQERRSIVESGAICLYLADLYGNLGPGQNKDEYYNWIVYCTSTLDEIMETLFVQWLFTDRAHQNTQLINKMLAKFEVFTKYLERTLEDRDYICGDRFTAADCVLGYNLWWATAMRDGVLLQNSPVILDYYERLSRRSAFQRAMMDDNLGIY